VRADNLRVLHLSKKEFAGNLAKETSIPAQKDLFVQQK
jgi:hypothetical protein